MYEVSNIFLTPVLILIVLLFVYAFFQIGVFSAEVFTRKKYAALYKRYVKESTDKGVKGYPVYNYYVQNGILDTDSLELFAFKKLQNASIVTRVAPMLGLVATMIPMGPALKALSNGNVQGISENLIIAFAAVIFALITASITYWITTKRKAWYAEEITTIVREQSV
ncbi:MAG: MotA/TolQ/ExbB proton channel family protein [Epsilonproteobacteria bacterium]|nr:MotA/TolQ/ExbB proton channel family protein [Campylobacterota bacterium]